ncbi:MAG: PDZ domain-containing protein, partial [Anaerolineales bacterium]|nr:PDZ domain-containing protein [Anaerolineales bacterium]
MVDHEPTGQKQTNWLVIGAVAIAALFLVMCVGLAGFALGRSTTSTETVQETIRETVTELVEVTREVTVVPTASDTGSAEQSEVDDTQAGTVDTPALPTTEPTAPPLTQETPTEPAPAEIPSLYSDISELDLDVLYEVWDIVERQFDGDLPAEEDLLFSLIEGSLGTLDDEYTRFIRPDIAARMREDMGGSISGIGAFVRETEDGLIEIVAPIEGQPAELVGLRAGDIIVTVDGESVIGKTFDEVLLLVRGPEGSVVVIEVAREGEEAYLPFTITRARFEVPVTEAEMLPGNIAYIRLLEFNQVATERMLADLDELLAQNPDGLILDLRNNPGGFLNQAVSIADIFLPTSVVLIERNNQGLDDTFRVDDGDVGESIPMVVLVNQASASDAEIVAGALPAN